MIKNFGIGALIFCFGLSSVDAVRATQTVEVPPIIVEPYDLRDINEQIIEQDRINRDQELAVRGLMDDKQKPTDTAVSRKQDASLDKIDQTMVNYRNFLIYRDRVLAAEANSKKVSKYYDLITLTENVDKLKGEGQPPELKRDLIEDKYKILTQLKDEMTALNEKLKSKMDQHAGMVPVAPMASNEILSKEESIRSLEQALAAARSKAEYYRLASRQNQKEQFGNDTDTSTLRTQVSQLGLQLSQKQGQVDLLKSELENKITQENSQNQQEARLRQDLKMQARRNASVRPDDRMSLAKRLIVLQRQEAALLEEKSDLVTAQNTVLEQHAKALEDKIKALLGNRQRQISDLQNQVEELNNELRQKRQQADLLKTELENKINEEKDQNLLAQQIRDVKAQLQDKEAQMTSMNTRIQAGQETSEELNSVKQQLASEEDSADQLKQQLARKTAESNKLTLMMGVYQKKLESRDNAYNEQLGQVLSFKNYKAQMAKKISYLNAQVQEKEAQVVKIKEDMYDLQESASAKEQNLQAKDLSESMVQQKMTDDKINEYKAKINGLQAVNDKQALELKDLSTALASARRQLKGIPDSDEVIFLKTGLKKAVVQLKQKDEMISRIKANADEYAKEFKEQSGEFKSLKEQLQSAYDEINRKKEDLKYKNMEIVRLKERSSASEKDLQNQVKALTRKLKMAGKGSVVKVQEEQYIPATSDTAGEKLKQALDKIDEQGRMINLLVQKLQDAGQTVDLSQTSSK